jgi:hypothetical protein
MARILLIDDAELCFLRPRRPAQSAELRASDDRASSLLWTASQYIGQNVHDEARGGCNQHDVIVYDNPLAAWPRR